MGARGPVPAPDNVRQLRGTKALKAPDGSKARRGVLPPRAPAAPAGLSPAAAAEWRRVAKEMGRAGVLAEVDRGILTAYCTAWAHMMAAEKDLKARGQVVANREGVPVKNPSWQIYREANRTMVAAAKELYLTPTSRLRFPVAPGAAPIGDDDGDDAFD